MSTILLYGIYISIATRRTFRLQYWTPMKNSFCEDPRTEKRSLITYSPCTVKDSKITNWQILYVTHSGHNFTKTKVNNYHSKAR